MPEAALRWRPDSPQMVVADQRQRYEVLLLLSPRQRQVIFVEEKGLVRPYFVRTGQTGEGVVEIVEGGPPEGKPVVIGLKQPE